MFTVSWEIEGGGMEAELDDAEAATAFVAELFYLEPALEQVSVRGGEGGSIVLARSQPPLKQWLQAKTEEEERLLAELSHALNLGRL